LGINRANNIFENGGKYFYGAYILEKSSSERSKQKTIWRNHKHYRM